MLFFGQGESILNTNQQSKTNKAKHFIMSLTTRRGTCVGCAEIAVSWQLMEKVENDMADGEMTEQQYIVRMALLKKLFEGAQNIHKEKGCSDHPTEEKEVGVSVYVCEYDDEEEIEVEEFNWRGSTYLIGDPQILRPNSLVEDRTLYDCDTMDPVGYVTSSGAVHIIVN
jgi:hypothetical protein